MRLGCDFSFGLTCWFSVGWLSLGEKLTREVNFHDCGSDFFYFAFLYSLCRACDKISDTVNDDLQILNGFTCSNDAPCSLLGTGILIGMIIFLDLVHIFVKIFSPNFYLGQTFGPK